MDPTLTTRLTGLRARARAGLRAAAAPPAPPLPAAAGGGAAERLAAVRGVTELAAAIVDEAAALAPSDHCALWVVGPDDPAEHVLEAATGIDPALLPGLLHAESPRVGTALAKRRAIGIHAGRRWESHLPLVADDRSVGLLSIVRAHGPAFTREESDGLHRLAAQASAVLATAVALRAALRAARVNRAVLDATPDPVGLVGPDGRLVTHNAAMAELWARHPGLDEADGDAEGEQHGSVVLGERTYARYAGPVRDDGGEEIGRLVLLRDVTAERESERLKDEFFALVSHELRTPLTSIIGYLELVHDDEEALPPDARRFLEVVDRNARRLLRLVGDMLFVAQAEAGRLSLERAPLDLGGVVADAVEAARPAAERGGVRLRAELEAVGAVDGDRDRLGQLVDNLVSNALKFTAEGGEVAVTLRPDADGTVQLAVRDDGVGIPEDEQQHLFERFFRSSSATAGAVPGAGLGLAIAKTIVEVHGGSIALSSTEGVGTAVRVRLPVTGRVPA